jgi:ribonuclease T1
MKNRSSMPAPPPRPNPGGSRQVFQFLALLIVVGLAVYSAWQQSRDQPQRPADRKVETSPWRADDPASAESHPGTAIRGQTIRDQDGEVVLRGDVDVGPTLARISRNERLDFPNDGTVFQNRERRLPQKPRGYYREYVHPTPSLRGPGPQRIVRGDGGETYYTPDHYRSFQRLDQENR